MCYNDFMRLVPASKNRFVYKGKGMMATDDWLDAHVIDDVETVLSEDDLNEINYKLAKKVEKGEEKP